MTKNFEVTMHRRRSLNAVQNARRRVEYVSAATEYEAKREANRRWPEFLAITVRRAA